MKKQQLQNFIDVVQMGSINKASEAMYISQPSLSRSIKALEDEMGKPLFIRNSRGVSLTATGKIFYNYAQSIMNQFNMLDRLKDLDEESIYSKLSIAVDSLFLQDDIILRFYREIHSIETEIKLLETTAEDVLQQVTNGTCELGITILNNYQLKVFKRMAELREISIEVLGESPLYIHAYKNSDLAKQEKVSIKEILSHIYIHLPFDFVSNLNYSLEVEGIKLSDLKRSVTMSNYHAIIKMLHATDSFIFGHKWQIEELAASGIQSMIVDNSDITKHFVIIKQKREVLSPTAQAFLKIIYNDYKPV